MVARKRSAEGTVQATLVGLFNAWRAGVARAGAVLSSLVAPQVEERERRLRHLRFVAPIIAGLLAPVLGGVARVALADEGTRAAAAWAAATDVAWAGGRLAIMAWAGRLRGRAPWGAWALGLIPFAVAVTPLLAAIAWAASGVLTWWTLRIAGRDTISARRMIAAAWGTQAAVAVIAWIAVNAWVVLLASG